jgi:hypothetical protein
MSKYRNTVQHDYINVKKKLEDPVAKLMLRRSIIAGFISKRGVPSE